MPIILDGTNGITAARITATALGAGLNDPDTADACDDNVIS